VHFSPFRNWTQIQVSGNHQSVTGLWCHDKTFGCPYELNFPLVVLGFVEGVIPENDEILKQTEHKHIRSTQIK
jgi:hypothetical protein